MNNLPPHSQVHFLPLLLKSSSSGVTINSDKQLIDEQTENPTLWGQCFWQVLEGGQCFWQVLEVVFQSQSYELIHQERRHGTSVPVHLHHQRKEKSQSHFFDCQNQCKELTLHLEKQTHAKGRPDLPAPNHPFMWLNHRRLLEAFVWLPACKDFQSSFTPHLPNQKRKPTRPPTT